MGDKSWAKYWNTDLSREEFDKLCAEWYTRKYMIDCRYSASKYGNENTDNKTANDINQLYPGMKILVGGCGCGGLVRGLDELGATVRGFDITVAINDHEHVHPSIYDLVVKANILDEWEPKGAEVLVTCDVLEHLPQNLLPTVAENAFKYGIKKMYHAIGSGETLEHAAGDGNIGHITYKPMQWWIDLFKPYYKHVPYPPDQIYKTRRWPTDAVPGVLLFELNDA